MNIYKVTERDDTISYTAAHDIFSVCYGKNSDFKERVKSIEEIEVGLGYSDIMRHKLPMDIVEARV